MTYVLDPDCELPPRLVALFLRTAPDQMQQLADACQRRDSESARACSHKLKGSLYAAGASHLAETLETLRTGAASEQWSTVDTLLPQIHADFTSVIEQLRAQIGGSA